MTRLMRRRAAAAPGSYPGAAPVPPAPPWDRVYLLGFALLLLWAPVPLASNRPWATAVLAILVWALVLAALAGRAATAAPMSAALWRRSAWLLLPLLGFNALVLAQLLAGQDGWWGGLLGTPDVAQTQFYLLMALAYLGGALGTLLCAHSSDRVRQVLLAVVVAGVVHASLAAVLATARGGYTFFFRDFVFNGRLSGTFANPDHLAGFMELCLSAGFGLLVSQFSGSSGGTSYQDGWQRGLKTALEFMLSRKMLLRLALVVMVVALVGSRSRMGNAAFFVALSLVGVLMAVVSTKLRKPAMWLVASMLVIDVFIVGQFVGLDRVVERWQNTAASTAVQAEALALPEFGGKPKEESLQQRMTIPMVSAQLVPEKPWFGRGGATYYLALPPIKPAGFVHTWDHAHNDYVEIAVDTGLVGLGLLLLATVATLWRAAGLLRDSQPRLHRGVGAAALMAITCMALHSLVDFNLQVPANALTLVVLMALVWAVPADQPLAAASAAADEPPRRGRRQAANAGADAAAVASAKPGASGRLAWGGVALLAAGIWAGVQWLGWPMWAADHGTQAARRYSVTCPRNIKIEHLPALESALKAVQGGIDRWPQWAPLRDAQAQLHLCRGAALWEQEADSVAAFKAAAASLGESLRLRGNYGATWIALAFARYGGDGEMPEILEAWQNAQKFGPHEAGVQTGMFELGLRVWPVAPPAMRDWVLGQYRAATPDQQKVLNRLAERLGQPGVLEAAQ